MATSYKIRLKRFNGTDYDTLNLVSSNIIMNTGHTLQSDIVPVTNGIIKNNGGTFEIATLGTDFTKINVATLSVSYSDWAESITGVYTQTITISGATITSKTKVDIQPDVSTIEQLIADNVLGIFIENNNGTLTIYSIGSAPTANINIQVTYYETV